MRSVPSVQKLETAGLTCQIDPELAANRQVGTAIRLLPRKHAVRAVSHTACLQHVCVTGIMLYADIHAVGHKDR